MLGHIINVIKESELDWISTPWAMVCLAQLLSWHVVADESSTSEASGGQDTPAMKKWMKLWNWKTMYVWAHSRWRFWREEQLKAPAHHTHIMIVPLRHAVVESGKAHPLPPGLQVLHAYTMLTAGSKHVSIVVWNMTNSAIPHISRRVCTCSACNVSYMLVPPAELPSEEETVKGAEAPSRMIVCPGATRKDDG